jgi:hypothetical protein
MSRSKQLSETAERLARFEAEDRAVTKCTHSAGVRPCLQIEFHARQTAH